jgi:hypothetical protein
MERYWRMYLAGADGAHPGASPFRAEDLSGVSPALARTAEYDPLRSEGDGIREPARGAWRPGCADSVRRHDPRLRADARTRSRRSVDVFDPAQFDVRGRRRPRDQGDRSAFDANGVTRRPARGDERANTECAGGRVRTLGGAASPRERSMQVRGKLDRRANPERLATATLAAI